MFLHNYYKKNIYLEPVVSGRYLNVKEDSKNTATIAQSVSSQELISSGQNLSENKEAVSWPNAELEYSGSYKSKSVEPSELQKRMKRCSDNNLSDDPSHKCDFLSDYQNTKYGCGYCKTDNKTYFGYKKGPLADRFKKEGAKGLCDGGWVPHTSDPKQQCIKKNSRNFCNKNINKNITQCPDVAETKIIGGKKVKCGWCPIKSNGYVSNDSGYPLYKEDKNACDWDMPEEWTNAGYGQLLLDKQKIGNEKTNLSELCTLFSTQYPCMGDNYETGPHSDACIKDIFSKYSKRGDVKSDKYRLINDIKGGKEGFSESKNHRMPTNERQNWEKNLKNQDKNWNNTGYIKLRDRVKEMKKKADSDDYETAKKYYKVVYGTEINPCKKKYAIVDSKRGEINNDDCMEKIWKDRGNKCGSEDAFLNPKNKYRWTNEIRDEVYKPYPADEYKKGIGNYNAYINASHDEYLEFKKIIDSKNEKEKLLFDEAIKSYKLCTGVAPKPEELKPWKPCWLEFVDNITIHRGIDYVQQSQHIKINLTNITTSNKTLLEKFSEIEKEYKTDKFIEKNKKNGNTLILSKQNYERDYFPFWKLTSESRNIWKKYYADKFKKVWNGKYKNILKYSGRIKSFKKITPKSDDFDYGAKYRELRNEVHGFKFE